MAVQEDKYAVVERFGAFSEIAPPGCLLLPIPCVCAVAGMVSTRVQQVYVEVQTKTKDSVFIFIQVGVLYNVRDGPDDRYNAFYRLHNPATQIESMVEDVVRGAAPQKDLDMIFLEKHHIAKSVRDALDADMKTYGYDIVDCLITDIRPDRKVKDSMNQTNASKRLRVAQKELAESEKHIQIMGAQADSEATYLQGLGVARQRQAITDWLNKSLQDFGGEMAEKEVLDLTLVTRYFDALKELSKGHHTNTIFVTKRPRWANALERGTPR